MMDLKERTFAPKVSVSLEKLVPQDNFYRYVQKVLDLSFVHDLVQERYALIGRPSIDPVVFFKLQLIMFFEDIRSERQLIRQVADRLSLRWYLGYDLDESLPDHSSLSKIRLRYGLDVFRCFFEAIVEQCQQAKLVWGKELYIDSTQVKEQFTYDPIKDQYCCPEGQVLSRIYQSPQTQEVRYRTEADICNSCPVKAQCTSSQSGRSLSRSSSVDEIERVKAYEQTAAYQKALRKRQVWVEPLFGEGKQWHGMSRFRLRRLWRVNCEALLIATGQNLKRLLRKRGWGRRPFPAEAVVALPPPDQKTDAFLKQDSGDFYRSSIAASAFDLSNALNPFLVTQNKLFLLNYNRFL